MKFRFVIAGTIAALALAGCQTTQEAQDDPLMFGRVDCRGPVGRPEVSRHFEQAKAICMNRADAAATAGTANMPMGYGYGGAIAAGINQGITAASIRNSTAVSCMAEQGYLLKRRSEFVAMCGSRR